MRRKIKRKDLKYETGKYNMIFNNRNDKIFW